MVEKNYTIPINEQFDKVLAGEDCGCPMCSLHKRLEQQNLDYIMGAAMMEPDVRIRSNETGFCRKHFNDMLAMKNRLSLALMLQSYLGELDRKLTPPKTIKFGGGRQAKNDLEKQVSEVKRASDACFVCERMAGTLQGYYSNVVHLWRKEPEFRAKFDAQPFFCFEHTAGLFRMAQAELPPKMLPDFCTVLFTVARKRMDVVKDEIDRFCKSFDYQFAGQPLGEAALGVEHAIDWVLGEV